MSRLVRAATCKCGAKILTGDDSDVCGIRTDVDQQPVDNLGEFLALATGRRTYELRPTATRGSHSRLLDERTAARIRTGASRHPIHPEHRCGQPLPAAPVTAAEPTATAVPTVILEGAPF
jgi:hypothetical protein